MMSFVSRTGDIACGDHRQGMLGGGGIENSCETEAARANQGERGEWCQAAVALTYGRKVSF